MDRNDFYLITVIFSEYMTYVCTNFLRFCEKALSIVIADGCECNALNVSTWMNTGKSFLFFLYFKMIITAVELAVMSEISKFRTSFF